MFGLSDAPSSSVMHLSSASPGVGGGGGGGTRADVGTLLIVGV